VIERPAAFGKLARLSDRALDRLVAQINFEERINSRLVSALA
jgi:hypothetical protein